MINNLYLISVAPMMDYTDRHGRYFLRLIAPRVRLYTEMITTHALIHGDVDYLLQYDALEHPLALQLGGSEPQALAHCAQIGSDAGYDEINLNVGCPSHRVKSGRFGACLMLEPALVAECVAAMNARVSIPVTVKCRIGVDQQDNYEQLHHFISTVATAGCRVFFIHARKAWLSGLSPKQNREIPPLQYDVVRQIKKDFPALTIILNGGLQTLVSIDTQLPHVDGVMVGRVAFSNPFLLAQLQEKYFFNHSYKKLSRHEIVNLFIPYIEKQLQRKTKLTAMTRHMLGLFQGQPGAAAWRRYLSEHAHCAGVGVEVIARALKIISEPRL